jgi:hypothetical protein
MLTVYDRMALVFGILVGLRPSAHHCGIAAQVILIVGIVGYVMPWLGLGLLDMAREVAAFNLPARIGHRTAFQREPVANGDNGKLATAPNAAIGKHPSAASARAF